MTICATISRVAFIALLTGTILALAPITTATLSTADLMPLSTAIFTRPGSIEAMTPLSDNRILVAGHFTVIGNSVTPYSLAIIRGDGSVESVLPFEQDLIVNNITDIAVQPDGKILLAGMFKWNTINHFLLRLHADGRIDQPFLAATTGIFGNIYTVLFDNNKLLIGGNFYNPTPYLARLNLDGTPDPSFTPATGPNGIVYDIARQSNGQYVIAGSFSTYNGVGQVGMARLQANGALDTSFVPGGSRPMRRVAILNDGTVIVGGEDICNDRSFEWYTVSGAARPLPDWPSPSLFESITAFLPLPDGGFLVGGWYSNNCINGNPTQHRGEVWRYAANGAYRTMIGLGDQSDILALAMRSDGNVMVGGKSEPRSASAIGLFNGLTLLSAANNGLERNPAFNLLVGDEATIYDLSLYPDGRILVSGDFSYVNGQPRFGLARLLANGQLDEGFAPLANQPAGWVSVALALPDGRAVIGWANGLYVVDQAQQLTNISALINYFWPTSLLRQPDGRVLVGASSVVYRLNAGLNAVDFQYNTDNRVRDLAFDPVSGKLIVAGDFGVIRLNSNGTPDPQFSAPTFTRDELPATIRSVAITSDGHLLVGGNFNQVNGVARTALARLASSGSLDTTFPAPTGFQVVNDICIQQATGAIWIGGTALARLSASGTDRMTLNYQPFQSNTDSLNRLICADTHLQWVGGQFGFIEQRPFHGVVRYLNVHSRVFVPLLTR
ncbi:hypothetical protein [Chloroflexus sp.]|uniref:hypothetical protein n=1 Tax=Chloroflexus sp. TaxID=1904827 RepID=UPI00260B8CC8|nr:hypothetical protein [uncultured Chloroflexus sp.]